jgi:lysophospholipase L1-like esterase
MAREQGRLPWWAVIVSGLCGALLAGLVAVLSVGGSSPVRAAAAERPVAEVGDAVSVPVVTFIGDSWTEGVGATALRGYAVLAAEQLDWSSSVLGVGGSGYVQPGRGSTFDQRVERAVATHPDVIVVQGSLNERRTPLDELEPATLRTLAHLRSAVDEDTAVLVVGSSYTPGTDRAVIDGINDTVAAAAERAGFEFVDPADENWTDPADADVWADPNHPNDAGHQQIADRLVPLLESLLDR